MSFILKKLCLILVFYNLPSWSLLVAENFAVEETDPVFFNDDLGLENVSAPRAESRVSANIKGDINKDGKADSRDRAIMSWLLTRRVSVENVRLPEIKSFTARPSKISAGESAELRWDVEGSPETLVINNGVGDVTNRPSVTVRPSRTTTYTLTAGNSKGSQTAEVTVEIVPKIESFTASPDVIRNEGDFSTLRWRISGRHSCAQINNDVGEVTGQTSVRVFSSGTYILKVFYAGSGQNLCSGSFVSRRVVIDGVPRISFFRARPSSIGHGAVSTLSWSIQGQTNRVFINHGVGNVRNSNSVEVSPESSTTYTLTAENNHGRSTRTARVNVLDLPVIESFTASRSLISRSDEDGITLRWEVSASGSFQLAIKEIDSEGNKIDSNYCRNLSQTRTSCFVFLSRTTTFVLTVRNSVGEVESESVRVDVLKMNTPDPSSIAEGQSSRLSWEGSESADNLELQKREDGVRSYSLLADVTGSDSYEVSPSKRTFYRLKARKSERTIYSNGVSVRVGGADFRADPPFVVKFDNPGVSAETKEREGQTRLRWSLTNIENSQITVSQIVNGNETDITSSCRRSGCTVTPADTATTYTLRVRNTDSNVDITKETTVDIFKIGRFKGAAGSSASTHKNCSLNTWERRAFETDHAAVECLSAASGQSVDLSWENFEGYSSLNLKTCKLDTASDSSCTETMQTVTDNGVSVTPDGVSSIYTLTAQKQDGDYSKTIELRVKVQVRDEVQVQSFSADDFIIKEGASDQTTRLEWNITGKDPVEFKLNKRPEGGSSSEVFSHTSPNKSKQSHYAYSFTGDNEKKTTEFTLTADNDFGSSDDETTKVYYLKIGSFTARDADGNDSSDEDCSGADQCLTVTSGTEVTLKWENVEGFGDERSSSCGRSGLPDCITDTLEITYDRGSHKISIDDSRASGGDETLSGSTNNNRIERAPSLTTTYTLTAEKQIGSETESLSKTVKIIVQDTPSISSFTVREGSSDTSDLNRILKGAETNTYLHYAHTGKDPYNLKLEEKPQGESSFTTGGGFNSCASDGGDACKNYRQVSPTKTTEYKLTLEKPTGVKKDERTIKVYKLGVERFKAQIRRSGENIDSCNAVSGDDDNCVALNRPACTGADECLTVTRNERIAFSWSNITGFEDERSGDLIQISKNDSDACGSSSYEDNSNPSKNGSVSLSVSNTAGTCIYTLTVQKTLGSGDNEETDKVTKTIKVSVNNPASIDYFESRTGASRADNTNINRIIENSGSTTLLWKIFSFTSSDTFKLKSKKEGESSADFEAISPSCTESLSSPSYVECSYAVSSIDKTTTYTLEATSASSGGQKVTSRPLKVYVLKAASFEGIRRLNGTNSTSCTVSGEQGQCVSIEQGAGEKVKLEWEIEGFGGEGTDTLEIAPNVQTGHGLSSCTGDPCKLNVKGLSFIRNVSPTVTTIYTLTAKKVIGSEEEEHSKKVQVIVGTRPTINTSAFKLTAGDHPYGTITICKENCGNADIEWSASGHTKVTISKEFINDSGTKVIECVGGGTYPPDCTDVSEGGAANSDGHSQSITRTTKFILKVENAVGERTADHTIKVFRIIEFKADPTCVSSGGGSTLSWKVAEGVATNGVSLDNSIGNKNSTCNVHSNGIETICTGTHPLSNLTATASYILTAVAPTGITGNLTSAAEQVEVSGSCTSSSSIGKRPLKISSVLLQHCENCPQMKGLSFLRNKEFVGSTDALQLVSHEREVSDSTGKSSSASSGDVSLADNNKEDGELTANSEALSAVLPPHSGEDENPFVSLFGLSEGGGDPAQAISASQKNLVHYSVGNKITYSQYQDCVNEGACGSLNINSYEAGSLQDTLSLQNNLLSANDTSPLDTSFLRRQESSTPLPQDTSSLQVQQDSAVSLDSSTASLSQDTSSPRDTSFLHRQESSTNAENYSGENLPLTFMSLDSAMQYAKWLSEKTGKPYGVLADPSWADAENFEREVSESFMDNISGVNPAFIFIQQGDRNLDVTEIQTQEGALYFMHPQNVNADEFYKNTLDHLQSAGSLQSDFPVLSESAVLSGNFVMFNSGFYVILPH